MYKKLWKESVIIIFGLSMLVACNGNNPFDRESDPLKSYSSLKDDVPEKQLTPEQREQNAVVKPFNVHVVSENMNRLQFVAGEEGRYEISARVYEEATYSLEVKNAPEGLKFTEKDADQGLWEVVWTPDKKLGSVNNQNKEFSLELELVITGGSEDVLKKFSALEKVVTYSLIVKSSQKDPVILGSEELDKISSVKEDQNLVFSLVVEDPTAFDNESPRIIPDYDPSSNTNESKVYYVGSAVVPHPEKAAEKIAEGRWKTYWIFNTTTMAILHKDKKVNNKVKVEFRKQAISRVTNRSSVGWSKQITIEFNPETETGETP